jgi:3D (Asp-Asp-Asp) domain-containing protein
MTKDEKRVDRLQFTLIIMFMFCLFGHNLNPNKPKSREQREKEWLEGAIASIGKYNGPDPETIEECSWEEPTIKKTIKLAAHKRKKHRGRVTVTQYNPVVSQCDEDPLVTADNSKIDLDKLRRGKIRWVAVSRDLLDKYNYGNTIELTVVKGNRRINGRYIVHDTMNPRFTNRVDILTPLGAPMDIWSDVRIKKIEEV